MRNFQVNDFIQQTKEEVSFRLGKYDVFSAVEKAKSTGIFQTSALTADQFVQLIEPEAAVQEVESPNIPAGPTLSVFK